jgi:hypothetical protein
MLLGEKSRSIASVNDAKAGEQSVSVKFTQYVHLERHQEPYNIALWTRK